MTDTEIKIAVAEWCGWVRVRPWEKDFESKRYVFDAHLPDYPNDLNAMYEAEQGLPENQKADFCFRLDVACDNKRDSKWGWASRGWSSVHSNARQRAVALLQTIGKWKD